MRWFKHLSMSSSDEKISEFLDEFGAEGYGVFWMILEKISQLMDESPRTFGRFSLKVWAKSCRVSVKKFQKLVTFLESSGIFSTKNEKNYMTISCPNLIKYRDEWTNRKINSGVTPEQLPSNSRVTPEQEAEAEAEANTNLNKKLKTEVISSSSSNSAHASYCAPQHAAAAKPLSENLETKIADRKIYLDCLLPVFPKGGVQIFQTVDVSRMFDGWHEQGVLTEDIKLAVSRISARGQKPSSPKYFDGMVLENCVRRKKSVDDEKVKSKYDPALTKAEIAVREEVEREMRMLEENENEQI